MIGRKTAILCKIGLYGDHPSGISKKFIHPIEYPSLFDFFQTRSGKPSRRDFFDPNFRGLNSGSKLKNQSFEIFGTVTFTFQIRNRMIQNLEYFLSEYNSRQ